MTDFTIKKNNEVQRFVTNAPSTLTNDTGEDIVVRLSAYTREDLHTVADDATLNIKPGMVVEVIPAFKEEVDIAFHTYEDTDFEDILDPVNTENKYVGKMLWDVTAGTPIWAAGPDETDLWVGADGATVYTPVGIPDAFTSGQWAVTDLSTSGDINIEIIDVPYDGNSDLTDIEYDVDASGTGVSLGAAIADDYPAAGFTDTVEISIRVRAVNAVGEGPWSDAKTVTPTV